MQSTAQSPALPFCSFLNVVGFHAFMELLDLVFSQCIHLDISEMLGLS